MLRWLIVPLLVFFLGIPIASAEFSANAWPYMRYIQYGPGNEEKVVGVKLDDMLLTQVFEGFRDVRVMEEEGKEIPYVLHGNVQKDMAKLGKIVDVSLNGKSDMDTVKNLGNLTDDLRNSFTTFPDDAKEVSLIFQLPVAEIIDRVNVFTYDMNHTWSDVQVEASHDRSDWNMLRSKVDFAHQTWRWFGFPKYDTPYSYYRVTFWTRGGMRIHELSLLTKNNAELVFESQPGETYAVYYGNSGAALPEYSKKDLTPAVEVGLASQQKNPQWDQDADGDNFMAREDNCPSIKNDSQEDADEDGLGDACELGQQASSTKHQEPKQEEIVPPSPSDPKTSDVVSEEQKQPISAIDSSTNLREVPAEKVVDVTKPGTTLSSTVIYILVALIIGIILGVSFHVREPRSKSKVKSHK